MTLSTTSRRRRGVLAGMAVLAAVGFASALTSGTAGAATQASGAAAPAAAHHKTTRLCAAPAKGHLACMAIKQIDPTEPANLTPNALSPNVTPGGYGPGSLQSAYALPSSTAGSGQTVGIVDAQDDPNAESDLAAYRTQYGLPACTTANGCFKKVNQSGATSPLPTADTGWAGEISLDLDMVSAICPSCHILLVEASTASIANLGTSVNTAVRLGAKFVSNSYGGAEDGTENTSDANYFNHPGVAITASSGDSDYDGGSYPATSKYVTAVGGTSLSTATNTRGWTEKVWNTTSYTEGAGSGCSKYVAKPAFQNGISTGCANRAEADVSAVADPATGVAVYQTYGGSGWAVYGGTSAAAPIVASVYALAGAPGATDVPNTYPYAHQANLNDVTSGSNGTCGAPLCTAGTGWDGPTGLGTPNGTAAFKAGSTTGGGCSGQKLGNPGFETGTAAPWTTSTGVIDNTTGEAAHSGTWKAWMNGYGSTHTDTLTQSVAIPTGCHATLSFWLHIDTAETGTTAYDKLTVKAGSTTLATYSNTNAATGYTQKSFDVSALAGQTITVSFSGVEDASLQTSFVVDDTALTLS